MLRMKDTVRFSLAAMRSGDAPTLASAFKISRSAGVQGACLTIFRFIRHKIGDHAGALPNLNVMAIKKPLGFLQRVGVFRGLVGYRGRG